MMRCCVNKQHASNPPPPPRCSGMVWLARLFQEWNLFSVDKRHTYEEDIVAHDLAKSCNWLQWTFDLPSKKKGSLLVTSLVSWNAVQKKVAAIAQLKKETRQSCP